MVRITQPIKVVTKEGEATVHITLELNINLNTGGLSISAQGKEEVKEEKEKTQWAIPEFGKTKKIEFGKTVQE
jgi:hypothetical protein